MPRFEPFAGIRYATDRVRLDDVIAPPYDVISPEEQAALEARSEYNAVYLELPRDQPDLDRYQAAARLFHRWQDQGVLARDPAPALYGYRMRYTEESGRIRHTVGVIGALGLETPGQGDIWPHEQTTPKDKSDRLQLLRATHANMSPIWGLSLARGLSDLLAVSARPGGDRLEATDDDGVSHQYWPITDPDQIAAITRAVSTDPVVIADGHHRFETALAYQQERPDEPGSGAIMMLLVELAEDQLSVRPVHRLISGLPDGFDVPAALSDHFELTPTDPPDPTIGDRMADARSLALVTADGTWLLKPPATNAGNGLDSSTLAAALSRLPPHDLVYQPGWDLATAAVQKGTAQAAFLLRPATVAQIAATGRGGQRMPPKTTFFWPKPRTGLVFREVDT